MNGQRLVYPAGEVIFREGDIGGSFYIITSGCVEVFRGSGVQEVILDTLKKNEVLGLLTLIDEGPRFASARAASDVECMMFKRSQALSDVNLPKWVQVVLKEFSTRLKQSNQKLSERSNKPVSQSHLVKKIYTEDTILMAVQLANGLSSLAVHYKEILDTQMAVVSMEKILEGLDRILSYGLDDLGKILEIFKSTGLIQVFKHPDRDCEIAEYEKILNLQWFASYTLKAVSGLERKQVAHVFPFKQRKCLIAIVDYIKRKNLDISKLQQIAVQELADRLKSVTGVPYIEEAIDAAVELKLVDRKGDSSDKILSFNGSQIVRTLVSVQTIQQLKQSNLIG